MSKRLLLQKPLHRWIELFIALAALGGALRLNYLAGRAAFTAGQLAYSEPDRLWKWLPVWDTSFVFVWGFAAFFVWLCVVVVWREWRRAAYVAWSYALLISVRSFFIILTPMRLPPEAVHVSGGFLFQHLGQYLTFEHDLFFSSHTACPFLAFLILRGPWIRLSFLFFSFLLAAAVLLGRLHYSIDVFSAFFITYALFKFEAKFFQPGYAVLRQKLVGE